MPNICTWIGKAFSLNWSDPKNWDTGAPPGPDDDAVIPGGQTYDSPIPPPGTAVRNLQISSGGLSVRRLSVKSSSTWQAGHLDAC